MMLAKATRAYNHARDCECCMRIDRKDIRAQRRRENRQWRKDAANND